MSSPPRPNGALRTHVEGMPPATPQSSLKGAGVVDDKENNMAAPPNVSATPQSLKTLGVGMALQILKKRRPALGDLSTEKGAMDKAKSPAAHKRRKSVGRRVSFAHALADIRTFERDADWTTPPNQEKGSSSSASAVIVPTAATLPTIPSSPTVLKSASPSPYRRSRQSPATPLGTPSRTGGTPCSSRNGTPARVPKPTEEEPTEEVSAPLVFPYKAVAATCVRPSTSPMFTTIAGGALTAAMAPVTAAFPSFTSPMPGLFGAPFSAAEMHTDSQMTTSMALETDSEAASPVEGAFGALMRAEQLQGGLLADLTGDITLSVPSLAELAAGGSDSTQELPSGDAAAMMPQESNVDECYAPDEQGITASLPQLAQLVMEHAAEEEEPHEEATMELTGTVSLSAAMADTEELHGGGITASLPAMADLLQELANDNGTDLDGVEDAASPPPSSSEQADEQADEQGAEMELTMNLGDALRSGVAAGMEQEQQEELTEGLGDVTAAVPNLADLLAGAAEAEAEADNTEGMDLTTGDRPTLQAQSSPTWQPRSAAASADSKAARSAAWRSRQSWGLGPHQHGLEEPTMDLELTNNARSLLSDQTFHAVFGAKLEHEDDRTFHLPQQATPAPPPTEQHKLPEIDAVGMGNITQSLPALADMLRDETDAAEEEPGAAEQTMELTEGQRTQSLTETLREGIRGLNESAPLRRISMGATIAGGPLLQPSPGPSETPAEKTMEMETTGDVITAGADLMTTTMIDDDTEQLLRGVADVAPRMEYDTFLETTGMSFLPTRRNTSFAGLGPVSKAPANLQESLYLLCVTAPEVAVVAEETTALQASVTSREEGYFQATAELSRHNPPLFASLSTMDEGSVEEVRQGLKHLKNHCRLEAKAAWQDVKLRMESRLHERLQAHRSLLQTDVASLAEENNAAAEMLRGVKELKATTEARVATARAATEEAAAAAGSVRSLNGTAQALAASIDAKRAKLAEARSAITSLQAKKAELLAERTRVQGEHMKQIKVDSALAAGTAAQVAATAAAASRSADDVTILATLNAWAVRPLATRADGGVRLQLALHRRYAVTVDFAADGAATVVLELDASPTSRTAAMKPELAVLYRVLMGGHLRSGPIAQWSVKGAMQVQELLQELTIQLGRVADLVTEVERLTTDIPGLASVSVEPAARRGAALTLTYVDCEDEAKFQCTLRLRPGCYPYGPLPCSASVQFAGSANVAEADVLNAVTSSPVGGWRLLQIHARLSELLRSGRTLRGWTHDSPLSQVSKLAAEEVEAQDIAMASGAVMVQEEQQMKEAEEPPAVPVTTGYSALFGFNPHDDDADDF